VQVSEIEVEAVVGGCLMRLRLAGLGPLEVLAWLKGMDPNAAVRTEIPSKSFGNRETLSAVVKAVQIDIFGSGEVKSRLISVDGEIIAVGSKQQGEFPGMFRGLSCLSEATLAAFDAAILGKKCRILDIPEGERFTVKFFGGDKGSWMEKITTDA
jgi:hypothetical protein